MSREGWAAAGAAAAHAPTAARTAGASKGRHPFLHNGNARNAPRSAPPSSYCARSPLDSDGSMGGEQELAMWGEDDLMPAVSAYRSSLDSVGSSDSL